ncbi:mannosyltransferase family protein [Effusibacillus dendaii]|uniref:Membrane protein n=1 Tax=Effusibacillus dendaii TaxID=2743772 RepID=A0A7I8DAB0_9BACL|nr:mannosyltransferase family protein [Effusibacillus dendaii]BCJ87118.1 membrane protein [Effusibacillus dendaii]
MSRRDAWIYSFILFLVHKVSVFGASLFFVSRSMPFHSIKEYLQYALIQNFVRWDSLWYLRIATDGYAELKRAAFFPLYPYLIRGLHFAFDMPYRIGGLLIANVTLLLALYLLLRLLARDFSRSHAVYTGLLLVVFPTSFYFSALYTESLFLFLTVGCLLSIRQEKWLLAGIFGFFAALTRNTGFLLVFPFLYAYLSARNFQWRQIRPDIVAIALIPTGLIVYMTLLFFKIGDPLGFVRAQKFWNRTSLWPWATLWYGTWDILTKPRRGWPLWDHAYEAIAAYLELLLIGLSLWKQKWRLPNEYLLYLVPAVIVPLCSPSIGNSYFYSIPRFIIVLFPLFAIWALIFKNKRSIGIAALLSVAGQWYLMDKFTRDFFVF